MKRKKQIINNRTMMMTIGKTKRIRRRMMKNGVMHLMKKKKMETK